MAGQVSRGSSERSGGPELRVLVRPPCTPWPGLSGVPTAFLKRAPIRAPRGPLGARELHPPRPGSRAVNRLGASSELPPTASGIKVPARLLQNLSNQCPIQNQFCVWVMLAAFLSFLMTGGPLTEEMGLLTLIQQVPPEDPGHSREGQHCPTEDMQICGQLNTRGH